MTWPLFHLFPWEIFLQQHVRKKVLALVPGIGLGVTKIPAAAGARKQAHPHPSAQSSDVPLLVAVPEAPSSGSQDPVTLSTSLRMLGRHGGSLGPRKATGSSGGRRRDRFRETSLSGAGQACFSAKHELWGQAGWLPICPVSPQLGASGQFIKISVPLFPVHRMGIIVISALQGCRGD